MKPSNAIKINLFLHRMVKSYHIMQKFSNFAHISIDEKKVLDYNTNNMAIQHRR